MLLIVLVALVGCGGATPTQPYAGGLITHLEVPSDLLVKESWASTGGSVGFYDGKLLIFRVSVLTDEHDDWAEAQKEWEARLARFRELGQLEEKRLGQRDWSLAFSPGAAPTWHGLTSSEKSYAYIMAPGSWSRKRFEALLASLKVSGFMGDPRSSTD